MPTDLETWYNGHRFPSRLHAQWAVFFDALQLPYQLASERAGPAVDSDPADFWLPNPGYWIIITSSEPTAEQRTHAAQLCLRTQRLVHVFVGEPYFNDTRASYRFVADRRPSGRVVLRTEAGLVEDISPCFWEYGRDDLLYLASTIDEDERVFLCQTEEDILHERLRAAYTRARQASFDSKS